MNIKNILGIALASIVTIVVLAPASFAGGVQIDNSSLTDVLVAKGVLTKDEAKAVKHNHDGKLKLGAKFFLNTRYNETKNNAGTTAKSFGLAVDRAYLTAKYSFNDAWMARITTDVHLDTNLGKKNNNIFLKYAYIQGKLIGNAVVLRLGQSHTPWIDYEQHLWKHRYVSKVMIDTKGFDASSDLGIGLKGKLAGGLVKYWVTETTGRGYSHPGLNSNGKKGVTTADLDGRLSLYPIKGLTMDFQFRNGFKGTKFWDPALQTTTAGTKHTLIQLMSTYGVGHDFRAGINYVQEKADPRQTAITDKTNGYALWGWYNFGNNFGTFGRYEYDKVKRTGSSVNPKTNRYLLGLEYSPVKHLHFSLVYEYKKVDNTGFTTGQFTKAQTIGLFSEAKF